MEIPVETWMLLLEFFPGVVVSERMVVLHLVACDHDCTSIVHAAAEVIRISRENSHGNGLP